MTMHDSEPGHTTVVDDNIGDYSTSQLFFRLAIGYADTSYNSVQSMLVGSLARTFAHAQVMHFLFEHAVELFLKGAIFKSTGKIEKTDHDLEGHYGRYRNLYPKKTFELSGRILDMVKTNPNSPHSEFPRFPTNTRGNVWHGYNAYTLEDWRTEIEHFRNDLKRLIPEIDPLPQVPFEA